MKKQYVKIGLIISIILGMLLCTGCKNLRKVYWDYDCFTETKLDGIGINFYIKGIGKDGLIPRI